MLVQDGAGEANFIQEVRNWVHDGKVVVGSWYRRGVTRGRRRVLDGEGCVDTGREDVICVRIAVVD